MTRLLTLLASVCLLSACGGADPNPSMTEGVALSADGVPIRYQMRGTGDPTLILLHGWTNDLSIWGEHPVTLARAHRVVTLDLAGHGESGDARTDWTIEAFSEDVRAVIDRLELDEVVLVGFSMGGTVALETGRRMPDRVLGIVLVDTHHDPEGDGPDPVQTEARFRASCCDTAFVRAFAFTPDAPDSLIRHVARTLPAEPSDHWFPMIHSASDWRRAEYQATLQALRVPLAAINTTRLPTNIEAWRRYAPSFTVDTLDGVGHAGILLQRVEDFDARLLAIVSRFRGS